MSAISPPPPARPAAAPAAACRCMSPTGHGRSRRSGTAPGRPPTRRHGLCRPSAPAAGRRRRGICPSGAAADPSGRRGRPSSRIYRTRRASTAAACRAAASSAPAAAADILRRRDSVAAEGVQQPVQQRQPQRQHRHGIDALSGGQGGHALILSNTPRRTPDAYRCRRGTRRGGGQKPPPTARCHRGRPRTVIGASVVLVALRYVNKHGVSFLRSTRALTQYMGQRFPPAYVFRYHALI